MKANVACMFSLGLLFLQRVPCASRGCQPMPSMPLLSRGVHGTCCVHSACEKGGSERSRSPARAGASGGVDPGLWLARAHLLSLGWHCEASTEQKWKSVTWGENGTASFCWWKSPLTAFHFLARFWEVRGSYNDAKDFPAGLEIATSPWTLRILGQLWRTCWRLACQIVGLQGPQSWPLQPAMLGAKKC